MRACITVLAVVLASLLACSSSKPESAKPAPSAPAPDPCAGLMIKASLDPMVLCGPNGESHVAIELVNADGSSMGTVSAGTAVKLVDAPALQRDGHAEQQICIASGNRTGTVAWVQSNHFFPRTCNAGN
jgi:hypothetical protein